MASSQMLCEFLGKVPRCVIKMQVPDFRPVWTIAIPVVQVSRETCRDICQSDVLCWSSKYVHTEPPNRKDLEIISAQHLTNSSIFLGQDERSEWIVLLTGWHMIAHQICAPPWVKWTRHDQVDIQLEVLFCSYLIPKWRVSQRWWLLLMQNMLQLIGYLNTLFILIAALLLTRVMPPMVSWDYISSWNGSTYWWTRPTFQCCLSMGRTLFYSSCPKYHGGTTSSTTQFTEIWMNWIELATPRHKANSASSSPEDSAGPRLEQVKRLGCNSWHSRQFFVA